MLPKPLTSLKGHPEIAQDVGLIVADYAVLDSLMYAVFALLSPEEPEQSIVAFYELRSAHLREELVTKAAVTLDEDYAKALRRLWRRFKKAANRRTEIAHCLFMDQGEGPMRMRVTGGSVSFEPLDAALIDRTFTQFHTLATDILTFLALASGSQANAQSTISRLPLSPLYQKLAVSMGSPNPPTPDEVSQTASSVSRLGLSHRVA